MKNIKLTGKYAAGRKTIVDDKDYPVLSKHVWWTTKTGYVYRQENRKNIYMHRIFFEIPEQKEVDHINLNKLDNRRINLRLVTHHQNTVHRNLQSNNTSGFRGVNWMKKLNKWRAEITIKGKNIHLGVFKDITEAVEAYNEGAKKHFGEFAELNKL